MSPKIKLAFFTNFDNHHQIPLADELFKLYGESYRFVTREKIPSEFTRRGYHNYERPYILRMERSQDEANEAMRTLHEAEYVLYGDAPLSWIRPRISAGLPVLFYNERWFKTGYRRYFHAAFWKNLLLTHFPSRWRSTYMMAASAYMRHDCKRILAYPDKVYRWGYFPEVEELDIDLTLEKKTSPAIKLVWCGTMTCLKHPELPIQLISELIKDQIDVHLVMIGQGPLLDSIKDLSSRLEVESSIDFIQDIPNEDVRSIFKMSDIFLFTSDWREGWGCVLNEAMASGCAVVASHEIGAVPYLIQHDINGLIFESRNLESLTCHVKRLVADRDKIRYLARNAYRTIHEKWSPKAAAYAMQTFIRHLEDPQYQLPSDGPCSKALNITPSSFLKTIKA